MAREKRREEVGSRVLEKGSAKEREEIESRRPTLYSSTASFHESTSAESSQISVCETLWFLDAISDVDSEQCHVAA